MRKHVGPMRGVAWFDLEEKNTRVQWTELNWGSNSNKGGRVYVPLHFIPYQSYQQSTESRKTMKKNTEQISTGGTNNVEKEMWKTG